MKMRVKKFFCKAEETDPGDEMNDNDDDAVLL